MDSRRLQSQLNSIEDNDNIELLLAHMRKIQNIANIRITTLIEAVIGTKKIDYKTSYHNTNGHLCKKANSWLRSKEILVVKS